MEKVVKNTSDWMNETLALIRDREYKEKMKKAGVNVVVRGEPDYPEILMQYREAPEFLFYKGNLPDPKKATVAIVGARGCSSYGRRMAKDIARDLSNSGVQVVSGLARGIDSYAALGALEGDTPTFAVLGTGVDVCYPAENIDIYERIIETGGGIISEYPMGDAGLGWHFPARNRIISGLANKVLVVEAKARSGSLITVEWAVEQNKDVCAVPGRATDKLSQGTNALIKNGALMTTNAKDILDDVFVFSCEDESIGIRSDLAKLYSVMDTAPKSVDELISETKLSYSEITEQLMELQMLGYIRQSISGYYELK
ncbi:MAG: DNA-processing protein DprA [Eubacterium sp.]|nr:DNA-processing protein DprA [Eubacterium sp.]